MIHWTKLSDTHSDYFKQWWNEEWCSYATKTDSGCGGIKYNGEKELHPICQHCTQYKNFINSDDFNLVYYNSILDSSKRIAELTAENEKMKRELLEYSKRIEELESLVDYFSCKVQNNHDYEERIAGLDAAIQAYSSILD